MLIQAHSRGEWQVGTHPDKHLSPALVMDVEVVLHHPSLRHLQMPSIILLVTDGNHHASWLATFHYGDDLIRFGLVEIRFDEFVAPSFGCLQDRRSPFLRPID